MSIKNAFVISGLFSICASICFAGFPDKGVVSVSPNGEYAIVSSQPWHRYLLNLFASGQTTKFSKVSMIHVNGNKLFDHVGLSGKWSADSECFGALDEYNKITLYFPKEKTKVETTANFWAKGSDKLIYLINMEVLDTNKVWRNDTKMYFSRFSPDNPKPQRIAEYLMPKNVNSIACVESCAGFVRFGYSYSVYESSTLPAPQPGVGIELAVYDLHLKDLKISAVRAISAPIGGGSDSCVCSSRDK